MLLEYILSLIGLRSGCLIGVSSAGRGRGRVSLVWYSCAAHAPD